jgi:hypothetical protein
MKITDHMLRQMPTARGSAWTRQLNPMFGANQSCARIPMNQQWLHTNDQASKHLVRAGWCACLLASQQSPQSLVNDQKPVFNPISKTNWEMTPFKIASEEEVDSKHIHQYDFLNFKLTRRREKIHEKI